MIKSVTIKNLKSIENETHSFTGFDLLVGMNNSGKSTVLQALAIWRYCVDEFRRHKRGGSRGVQLVLPNFTVLPLPEFNLLWTDKIVKKYIKKEDKNKQEFVHVEIVVKWLTPGGNDQQLGVSLRIQTHQAIYAMPSTGWKKFKEFDEKKLLPKIVYVPPFSGLETYEEWRDDSILRRQVGKAQPGSVLRNLLYRVTDRTTIAKNGAAVKLDLQENHDWLEITKIIKRLFSISLEPPLYEKGVDTQITCNYTHEGKQFDIIGGGSGFHQMLTLLASMYGYEGVTTILFDEPDAHMHNNLQREMLDFLKRQSRERNIQFIIATHAEELIKGVEPTNIISLLEKKTERIQATCRR
jgi:AAA15 family ATPase/GTPase